MLERVPLIGFHCDIQHIKVVYSEYGVAYITPFLGLGYCRFLLARGPNRRAL